MIPRRGSSFATALAVVLFVAAVAVLPLFVDDFQASQYAYVGIYFIAICGLNILTGYTGQISLGHGAFMAVGGYTTAILAAKAGFPYWTTIPLAGIAAGAAGLLLAIPALRLSGLYLALATFGLALAAPALIKKYPDLTGGSTGLSFDLVSAPSWLGLTTNDWFYYLSWTIALVLLGGRVAAAARSHGTLVPRRPRQRGGGRLVRHPPADVQDARVLRVRLLRGRRGRAVRRRQPQLRQPGDVRAAPLHLPRRRHGGGRARARCGGSSSARCSSSGSSSPPSRSPRSRGRTSSSGPTGYCRLTLDPSAIGIADFVFGAVLVGVMILLPKGAGGLLRRGVTGLADRLYTR